MAAPMKKFFASKNLKFSAIFAIYLLSLAILSTAEVPNLSADQIERLTFEGCVVVSTEFAGEAVNNLLTSVHDIFNHVHHGHGWHGRSADASEGGTDSTHTKSRNYFPKVAFGNLSNIATLRYSSGFSFRNSGQNEKDRESPSFMQIVLFKQRQKDYTCLLRPSGNEANPSQAKVFLGPYSLEELLRFINSNCGTFMTVTGEISPVGLLKVKVIKGLSQPEHADKDHGMDMRALYADPLKNPFKIAKPQVASNDQCLKRDNDSNCSASSNRYISSMNSKGYRGLKVAECDKINVDSLSWEVFFQDYLLKSKPVIIKGGAKVWPAMSKWTNEFLLKKVGNRKIHVKVADHGRFEGCENGTRWEGFESFPIPPQVKEKLPFPDLVVVRPAPTYFKFPEFFNIMTSDVPKKYNMSAYIEYASLQEYMPSLVDDIREMPFLKTNLPKDQYLQHLNVWLSDGNTLGKLHFDAYENFLCQISGKKQVVMFDPFNNSRLYEGHIQEAELSYNHHTKTFARSKLMDSTAMVMSPVDILEPDFERFPLFGDAVPLNCTIEEGDVLYMPSFWWHEVQSFPNETLHRNMAVNYWYKPFLTKNFPCLECQLDVNPAYIPLLEKYHMLARN